jgi:hypothetical protein
MGTCDVPPKTSTHNIKTALLGAHNHKLARSGQLNSQIPPASACWQKSARPKTIGACNPPTGVCRPRENLTQAVKLRPEYRPSHPLLPYYRKVTKVNEFRSAALDIGDITERHIASPAGSNIAGLSV